MFRYLPKRISHSRVKHCCARLCVSGHRTKSTLGTEDNYATKSGLRENMIEMKSLFNEMNQKMNGIKQKMNELHFQSIKTQQGFMFALSGLLATLMIALHGMSNSKIQHYSENFSKRIEAQDARFEAQNDKFQAQDRILDAQDSKIQAQDARFDSQNDKIEAQDRKMDAQDSQIRAQDKLIASRSK